MINFVKKNLSNILIWGITLLFTALYVSLIFNINITTDEIFTLKTLKQNLTGMIQMTADDVHPPLYYFYAKLFDIFSPQNIHLQKIATIIPMTGTLIYVATVVRKRIGDMATFFALLMFTCMPCTMEYAVQIRMYSLAILCVTVCVTSAYIAFTEMKAYAWILFVVSADAAAYLHYFSFVAVCYVVGFLFICIILKLIRRQDVASSLKQLKYWGICVIAMIIIYLPWLPVFISQVTRTRAGYWIAPIDGEVLWSYFTWAFDLELQPGFVYILLAILSFTGIYGIVRIIILTRKNDKDTNLTNDIFAYLCMLVPTLTTASGVIISLSKAPIFCGRYVIVAMMPLSIWWGIEFSHILKNKIGIVIAFIVSIVLLYSGAMQYRECFYQEYRNGYAESTVHFFEANLGDNDYVLYNYKAMEFVYDYYFPSDRLIYVEDFDFDCDYDNAWFLYTQNEWPVTYEDCANHNLDMAYIGLYGVEGCNVDLFKISHR